MLVSVTREFLSRSKSVNSSLKAGLGAAAGALALLACLASTGCAKTEVAGAQHNSGGGKDTMKGIWLASVLDERVMTDFIERSQALGLNTVALHVGYAQIEDINAFAKRAKTHGISTHAWVESGIKAIEREDNGGAGLYLPCSDGGADMGVHKYYLDLTQQKARLYFLEKSMALVNKLGPDIDAIQWDDHLGYYTSRMSCINGSNRSALQENLSSTVNTLIKRIRQAKPNMKIVFSHNNEGWARDKYLADWRKWNVDSMIIQAYVSNSFSTEAARAPSSVHAMGINGTDPNIVRNTSAAFANGLGVIYFKFPPASATAGLAAVLKARGSSAHAPSGRPTDDPVAQDPVAQKPVPQNPGAQDPVGPDSGEQDAAPVVNGPAPAAANDGSCAVASAELKAKWAGYCTASNAVDGAPNGKTACEINACKQKGGGYSCATVPYFQKNFFCNSMLPVMVPFSL